MSAKYAWKNVAVSGLGCWVTGIEVHPQAPHTTYMRTDVGGAYRWDEAGARWISLSNHFTYPEANYYGVESLALDVNAPDVVYMACGTYTDKGDGALFKSTNRGATWTKLGLSVPMGGNQEKRWGGERLAVSPQNGNLLLFGSRRDGLLRSTDGGKTWTKNVQIPITKDNLDVSSVAFDPMNAGVVYASVSGKGIYASRDGGANWTLTAGGPLDVRRLVVTKNGELWATHGIGVSKWNAGKWNDFAPGGVTESYCGIAVNPSNPNDVLVSDLEGRHKAPDGGRLFRTFDGGATWKRLPAIHTIEEPSWGTPYQVVNVSALAFNPRNLKQVWAVSGAGTRRTNDIDAPEVNFKSIVAGHEETCVNMLATPPSGPELFSAMLDVDGFVHDKGLDEYPTKRFGMTTNNWLSHTMSITFQEDNPSQMMRIGTQGFAGRAPTVAVSTDAGQIWNPVPSFPAGKLPLHGAISTGDAQNMLVMCNAFISTDPSTWKPVPIEEPWQFTKDGGKTWQISAGVPRTAAAATWGIYGTQRRIAADPIAPNTFYIHSQDDGAIYRSSDGGANFSRVNTAPNAVLPNFARTQLKVQPGARGQLWASFTQDSSYVHAATRNPREGLYRSGDGGSSWQKIAGVSSGVNFGFGKAAPGSNVPALYLYGRLQGDDVDKIYRSTDLGAAWTNITDPNMPVGNQPLTMEGSRQTFGRVFIGTNGSGIFYGNPTF